MKARDYAVQARRKLALKMRLQWPPPTIKEIAQKLGCAEKTIIGDLDALRTEHLSMFDGSQSAALATELLRQYDYIAGMAMADAEKLTNPTARSRMMNVATRALAVKGQMMLETGAVKRVPVRQEHTGANGAPLALPLAGNEPQGQVSIRERARRLREQRAASRPLPEAPAGPASAQPAA